MRYAKVAGNRIRVFWSNKYVKFDKLLFLAHDSVEWIVKPDPDTNHRLEIQIKYDGNRDRFDVILQTIASLRIVDPARVLCFELG
jgi:hypothetical protein